MKAVPLYLPTRPKDTLTEISLASAAWIGKSGVLLTSVNEYLRLVLKDAAKTRLQPLLAAAIEDIPTGLSYASPGKRVNFRMDPAEYEHLVALRDALACNSSQLVLAAVRAHRAKHGY